jgi:hypothetical protein
VTVKKLNGFVTLLIYFAYCIYKPLQMRPKITFFLLLAVAISACNKSNDVPSSASIVGSWKFNEMYSITIFGAKTTLADPAKPIVLNFNSTAYSKTIAGKLTQSGTYMLLDKYQYYPGYYATNVLKLDSVAWGTYAIHRGNPDTLLINSIESGPDYGGGSSYLRVK